MDGKGMKCWSFVHNIAVLRINAPFPPFPMPSSNLIGFGTWWQLKFRRNYFHASYLFIYYENHTQSTVIKNKRQEIHWSMLNAQWACWKAISSFTEFIRGHASLSSNSGVLVNGTLYYLRYPVLSRFPIIAQRSNACTTFVEWLV